MPRTDVLSTFAALLLAAAPAAAQSDYSSAPFRDQPVPLAQAAALERIEASARALAVARPSAKDADDDGGKEADEQDEAEDEGPMADLALLKASLAAASPKLARAFVAAVGEMAEAAGAGKNALQPAEAVVRLSGKARAAMQKSKAVNTPAFHAALMASLLLDEGGVSEIYEDAAGGDRTAYTTGYFVLRRVKTLWKGLSARATPEQTGDVEQMLAMLDALFPGEKVPEHLSPDPEEAEAPSHQVVTLLETVTKADLYPGRDLAGTGALVHDLAQGGCKALASKKDRAVGAEKLTIAAGYYGQIMKNTVAMMAPDAAAAIEAAFASLREAMPEGDAHVCGPLLNALAKGQAALTP